MDPNHHMRHSAYNDYAAQTRIAMFQDYDLPLEKLTELGIGPILFREETIFRKEITLSERITVTCQVSKMNKDGSRWTILHTIYKKDETVAAEITVDGSWIDLESRKLADPPQELEEIFHKFPRTEDFKWLEE